MSNKVNVTDFPKQTVYLQDSTGDYIRHTFGTDEFWRLSPDKQVAIRYQNEAWRGKGADSALYADMGFVRSFPGTVSQFFRFLTRKGLLKSEILFQDRNLQDECQVQLGEYDDTGKWTRKYRTAAELEHDLVKNNAFEEFEGHLIFFTTNEPGWHADTKI